MSTALATQLNNMAVPTIHSIKALEVALANMEPREGAVEHVFAKGIYMRYITLPKDTILTTKVHNTQHISIILTGDVTISTPDGKRERVQGPRIFITEPNTKRAIAVHEETTWATFHVTDETNLDKIEAAIIAEDYV